MNRTPAGIRTNRPMFENPATFPASKLKLKPVAITWFELGTPAAASKPKASFDMLSKLPHKGKRKKADRGRT